jgi:hypothetical protein
MEDNDETSAEDQLKFENELKKLKLRAESGASFFEGIGPELPPEVESHFLDHILAFETSTEAKKITTVRKAIGNPTLIPVKALSEIRLLEELEQLEELMESHNIILTMDYDVTDQEIYRFLVEELMDEEFQVIEIDGYLTEFVYEEFHPNHEAELKESTEAFIDALFTHEAEELELHINDFVEHKGELIEAVFFLDALMEGMEGIEINEYTLKFTELEIDDDKAKVVSEIMIASDGNIRHLPNHIASFAFVFDHEQWNISKFDLPSFGL